MNVARLKVLMLAACAAAALAGNAVTRAQYLDIVEMAVSAYTPEHRAAYLARVREKGIEEHGFPRLAANMGLLLATGRWTDARDKALYKEMMDECCGQMATAKARNGGRVGNDFTVKEVILCLYEVERAGIFPKETTDAWRAGIARCVPKTTYTCIPRPDDPVAHNWAIFAGASEQLRCHAGLGGDPAFVERQFAGQLRFFDANGMYRDPNQPLVYDGVTRLQLMLALRYGYDGPSRAFLEEQFLKSAEPTLLMQSATGEIPFGGRSNQFLHNEGFFFAVCEWYAAWFKARGDLPQARRFRAAARRAFESLSYWAAARPLHHVKNRFPRDSKIGCENYGYFDKYMVTLGSWATLAYLFAEEDVPDDDLPEDARAAAFSLTPDFHMTLLRAGGHSVQFDAPADAHYDGSGIGRIQRRGAPPPLALSVPFAAHPKYGLDVTNATPLAILPGWRAGAGWAYAYGGAYTNLTASAADGVARMDVDVAPPGLHLACDVSARGVTILLAGEGELALTLPVFLFDGERRTSVVAGQRAVAVSLDGWTCRYETEGEIVDTGLVYGNRNGRYRRYEARGRDSLTVRVTFTESRVPPPGAAGTFAPLRFRVKDLPGVTGHVQGMCAAEDALYFSTHNAVVKADWGGKVLAIRKFASHMGDLAWHEGRVYCSWGRRFGQGSEALLLVLDADLNEVARKQIPGLRGIDGVTVMGDRLYFGAGGNPRAFHRVNRLGMADLDLNVIGYRDVDYGVETNFGAQNIFAFDGRIYAFFYTHLGDRKGSPLKCCVLDRDLNVLSAERFNSSQGIDVAPSRFGGTRERPVFVKSHAVGKVDRGNPDAAYVSVSFWTIRDGQLASLSPAAFRALALALTPLYFVLAARR